MIAPVTMKREKLGPGREVLTAETVPAYGEGDHGRG